MLRDIFVVTLDLLVLDVKEISDSLISCLGDCLVRLAREAVDSVYGEWDVFNVLLMLEADGLAVESCDFLGF